LPEWALELQEQKLLCDNERDSNNNQNDNNYDDYDNLLKDDIDVSQ